MKKEYKIELTVVIDDANRQHLIDLVRDGPTEVSNLVLRSLAP